MIDSQQNIKKVIEVWTVKNATTKTRVVNKFQFPFTRVRFRRSISANELLRSTADVP